MSHLSPENRRGFYTTPNKMIPYNDREPGEIADIAWQQLRKFQQAADTWPLVEHRHHTDEMPPQIGMCCRFCDQTVYFTHDTNDVAYHYQEADRRAVVVAHIRRCHEDKVNNKGEIISEAARKPEILDVPGRAFPAGFDSSNAHRPDYQGGDSRGIEYT